jgi:hypothetical protein
MHICILNKMGIVIPKGFKGDHEDRNKLNNQEYNLRVATNSQNNINCIQKSTSGYRGVCYHKRDKVFQAHINVEGKQKHLGYFDDPIVAAKTYDNAARKYHGEFAILNF